MTTELLLVLLVMVLGFASLYMLLRKTLQPQGQQQDMEAMVNQVFGLSAQKIAEQSKQILSSEKETIRVDLDNKQKAIEKLVTQLQDDLKTRQQEIRLLEQDRSQKFSELHKSLEFHSKQTEDLKITAQQLTSVLSNNQLRGEWGERIIEDILRANGLVEGVHYLKQQKQLTSALRPDITLLLPNERFVPVDVKFPYSAIQKMAVAESTSAKNAHIKQFTSDVKTKIAKVSEYIDPSQNTLDYAILFVPNEMIFSFINQKFPELVDEAISKRVLLVSPFTFLIVARTVIESYRNFMLSDKLRDVVKAVDEFGMEWGKFKDKFSKYGRSLDTLKLDYEDLVGTRMRQMDRRVDRIGKLQQGTMAEVKAEIEKVALLPDDVEI